MHICTHKQGIKSDDETFVMLNFRLFHFDYPNSFKIKAYLYVHVNGRTRNSYYGYRWKKYSMYYVKCSGSGTFLSSSKGSGTACLQVKVNIQHCLPVQDQIHFCLPLEDQVQFCLSVQDQVQFCLPVHD